MSPCREGTGWLEKYYTESKTVTDVKKTLICYGVSKVKLKETQFVHYGDRPVAAAIRHFREEFEYHVRSQKKKQEPFCCRAFEKVKHLVSKVIV
jgi:NADH-quinone oxidoreductase subunit F